MCRQYCAREGPSAYVQTGLPDVLLCFLFCFCCAMCAQVYSESAPMKQALPDYLAEYMQRKLAIAGVTPMAVTSLTGLR